MLQVLKNTKIRNAFVTEETTMGCKCNQQILPSKEIITWNHFYATSRNSLMVRVDSGKIYKVNI